ncbi:FecR domain-containing protein [Pseudomonas putida]|uniref:FecR domain-containing protein n=1 Tax=Pseudomonas putida TaxID=303 RepID=UPI0021F87219|nr:FecR domain-containing protein [Pseudomonas putida]
MNASIPGEVAEQAMHWHLELQEPAVTAATLAACMSWRQAHPLHEHAWQRTQVFAQRMHDMRSPGQRPLAHAALRPQQSRRNALKQLSLLLAAGSGAWYLKDAALVQDWRADYHSRIGEQRRLTLADGTQLQLNTDSALDVAFDHQARRLRLLRGEMLITRPALADSRPLWVDTVHGRLESTLAQFNVRLHSPLTQVSVYQGTVSVRPALQADSPLVLGAGEQASFTRQGLLARQAVAPTLPAWSQGMLVAQGQRLAAFLEDVSRYRRGHLACDPALASLRVSGTFPLDNTEKIIAAVAETLQLDVQHFTRYWVTLKPRMA